MTVRFWLSACVLGLVACSPEAEPSFGPAPAADSAGYDNATTQALIEQNNLLREQLVLQQQQQLQATYQMEQARLGAVCDQHYRTMSALEERFANLSANHGMFLDNIKSCTTSTDPGGCVATVCLGAAFLSGGEANCVDVAAQSDQIYASLRSTRQSAATDGCQLPNSPVLSFYDY